MLIADATHLVDKMTSTKNHREHRTCSRLLNDVKPPDLTGFAFGESSMQVERLNASDEMKQMSAVDAVLPRILVIDDDPGAIQVLHKALQSFADIRFATSGEAGLTMAADLRPDLILLDAEMPGLSGLETLDRIQGDPLLGLVLNFVCEA